MKRLMLSAAGIAVLALPAFAHAQDYEGAVKQSLGDYATAGAFKGVTLTIACRHLPAMDFIQSHTALFEQFSGAKITFTDYPENDLRSHIVADAANKAGGFQLVLPRRQLHPAVRLERLGARTRLGDQARLQS